MAKQNLQVLSHWYNLIEGLQESAQEFYSSLEQGVASKELPNIKISRIEYKEGGLISAKREYLRIKRKDLIFDVCAAPFGKGFFVSWWLGTKIKIIQIFYFV